MTKVGARQAEEIRESDTEEQNKVLTRIHGLAVRLASLPTEADLPALLSEELQAVTGAEAVTFGEYREEDRSIVLRSLRTDSGLLEKFVRSTGLRPMEIVSLVDEASLAEMLEGQVAYRDSLSEVTFGKVPEIVSTVVAKLFGIGKFLGISYVYEGKVYGASVLVFKKGKRLPREDYLTAFSALAAVSLRRRVAESEIRRLNEGLESTVAERTRQLRELNAELGKANAELERTVLELKAAQSRLVLSEKMATLGQLMAGIAHELNTPLGAILSSARTAHEGFATTLPQILGYYSELPEGLKPLFTELYDQASQRQSLDLGAFSREARAERRRVGARLEAAGIEDGQALAEALAELGASGKIDRLEALLADPRARELVYRLRSLNALSRSIAVIEISAVKAAKVVEALRLYARNDSSATPLPVDVAASLESVLILYYNKTKQAVEIKRSYAPHSIVVGRVEELEQVWVNLINNALQAMEYRGRLDIGTELREGELIVRVADDGPGIPEEIQGRIFEPFFTTKAAGEGSGLGLDIARKIVENHGGSLAFESRPGHTVFSVTMPAAGAERT